MHIYHNFYFIFRVYNFDFGTRSLSLLYNVQLENHCILKLAYILNCQTVLRNILFITATTSGHLNFASHKELKSLSADYKSNFEIKGCLQKPIFQVKLHQSGINALDLKKISGKFKCIKYSMKTF